MAHLFWKAIALHRCDRLVAFGRCRNIHHALPEALVGAVRDSGVDIAAFKPLTNRANVSCLSGFGSGSSKVKPPSGSKLYKKVDRDHMQDSILGNAHDERENLPKSRKQVQ